MRIFTCQKLFSFDDDSFGDLAATSKFYHKYGTLARYNGNPLAIGCGKHTAYDEGNTKVELLEESLWKIVADYPTRYLVF